MSIANFAFADPASDAAGLPVALSIFADRAHVRDQVGEDAMGAGLRIAQLGDLATLIEGDARSLGDIVAVDCPEVDGARLAALARLDMRIRHVGAQLVVSTSLAALDDVFGCLDQSNPQILIDPTRAERVIALGRALAAAPGKVVRELSEEDRLALMRLTQQVSEIGSKLERLAGNDASSQPQGGSGEGAFRFESPKSAFAPLAVDGSERLVRAPRPPLPDPRLVRRIIRHRQMRARFFDGELFADPAWDMLLDLTAARAEHARVSVTSLCIASGVPPTTALRWIGQMTECGLFQRVEDEADRRRAFITLTDKASDAMSLYFAELGPAAPRLV